MDDFVFGALLTGVLVLALTVVSLNSGFKACTQAHGVDKCERQWVPVEVPHD